MPGPSSRKETACVDNTGSGGVHGLYSSTLDYFKMSNVNFLVVVCICSKLDIFS